MRVLSEQGRDGVLDRLADPQCAGLNWRDRVRHSCSRLGFARALNDHLQPAESMSSRPAAGWKNTATSGL